MLATSKWCSGAGFQRIVSCPRLRGGSLARLQPSAPLVSVSNPACPARHVNMNASVRTRWEKESREVNQQRTDYDFDKEKWMKQMRIDTMDCIVDPTIEPVRYTSWKGIRRAVERFVTMRKLQDRRPDFSPAQLQDLFISLKKISNARNLNQLKTLQLLTTNAEASRIAKETRARMNRDFTSKSWKALKQQNSESNAYDIEVVSFELVHCYMGQMAKEDWLQLTYRCEFKERNPADVADAASASFGKPPADTRYVAAGGEATPQIAAGAAAKQQASPQSSATPSPANTSADLEWRECVEFPVFEVKLTDAMAGGTPQPFKVVGVMKKDGTRYGKDAQDASALRKQFDRSKKWF